MSRKRTLEAEAMEAMMEEKEIRDELNELPTEEAPDQYDSVKEDQSNNAFASLLDDMKAAGMELVEEEPEPEQEPEVDAFASLLDDMEAAGMEVVKEPEQRTDPAVSFPEPEQLDLSNLPEEETPDEVAEKDAEEVEMRRKRFEELTAEEAFPDTMSAEDIARWFEYIAEQGEHVFLQTERGDEVELVSEQFLEEERKEEQRKKERREEEELDEDEPEEEADEKTAEETEPGYVSPEEGERLYQEVEEQEKAEKGQAHNEASPKKEEKAEKEPGIRIYLNGVQVDEKVFFEHVEKNRALYLACLREQFPKIKKMIDKDVKRQETLKKGFVAGLTPFGKDIDKTLGKLGKEESSEKDLSVIALLQQDYIQGKDLVTPAEAALHETDLMTQLKAAQEQIQRENEQRAAKIDEVEYAMTKLFDEREGMVSAEVNFTASGEVEHNARLSRSKDGRIFLQLDGRATTEHELKKITKQYPGQLKAVVDYKVKQKTKGQER